MKRIYLLLVLALAAIVSILIWQGSRIRATESSLRKELSQRNESHYRPSSALPGRNPVRVSSPRAGEFDEERFLSDMTRLAGTKASTDAGFSAIEAFQAKYMKQLANASADEIKKVCGMIEEFGLNDSNGMLIYGLMGLAAKSDPSWAISTMDRIVNSHQKGNISMVFESVGKRGMLGARNWNADYIAAAVEWAESAVAAGRLNGVEAELASMRFDLALATDDMPAAYKQLALLPMNSQREAATALANATRTADERQQSLVGVSAAASPGNLQAFAESLAKHAGFEAARDALVSAKLSPESHDIAAGGLAAATIGPETAARAAWLLKSLRSDDPKAIGDFMGAWAHGDFDAASQWLNALPPSGDRDAAVAGFVRVVAKIDGATAVDWTATVADPGQRASALAEVYQEWKRRDPEAAAAYLRAKGMRAEE